MIRYFRVASLAWLAAFAGLGVLRIRAQELTVAPSARNWAMQLFSKEGHRTMTLRGSTVRPVDADRIDIFEMNVTVFGTGPTDRVDTILLSPEATFLLKEKIASGPLSVRMVRDDVEVTGEGWRYDFTEKKVSLARNARVVFRVPLPDLLK